MSFQTWNWVDGSWDMIRMIFANPCHRYMNQGVPYFQPYFQHGFGDGDMNSATIWGCSSSKLIGLYSHSCGGYSPNLGWIVQLFIVFCLYMEITITSEKKKQIITKGWPLFISQHCGGYYQTNCNHEESMAPVLVRGRARLNLEGLTKERPAKG
jgi:hypothetical protein